MLTRCQVLDKVTGGIKIGLGLNKPALKEYAWKSEKPIRPEYLFGRSFVISDQFQAQNGIWDSASRICYACFYSLGYVKESYFFDASLGYFSKVLKGGLERQVVAQLFQFYDSKLHINTYILTWYYHSLLTPYFPQQNTNIKKCLGTI